MEALERFAGGRVLVLVDDLTRQEVAAIVNAANSTLLGGGGVDGAIHRAGGPQILEECREIRRTLFPDGLPAGQCVLTTAGLLPARRVIHTVGPIYGQHGGREPSILAECYRNALQLAAEHDLETIAFPAISTGAYAYPRHEAAAVASQTVEQFLQADRKLGEVRLVFHTPADAKMFLRHQQFNS